MALFWDLRPDLVRRFCDAGMVVICQVGSAGEGEPRKAPAPTL